MLIIYCKYINYIKNNVSNLNFNIFKNLIKLNYMLNNSQYLSSHSALINSEILLDKSNNWTLIILIMLQALIKLHQLDQE